MVLTSIRMAKLLKVLFFLVFLCNVGYPSWAQTCTKSFSSNRLFSSCKSLQQLNANFAWTYAPGNGSIRMAFTAKPDTSGGWVSWGINPSAAQMAGTQSLIAFKHSNGTLLVLTYNITEATKSSPPEPSPIDFIVQDMAAEFLNNQITIFATWMLKNNQTTVNHVWNTGGQVQGVVPQSHAMSSANLASKGTIDLKSGVAITSASAPHQVLKNRHGVLNAVGWGILLPIGIMFARYLRQFESADPAWFYLHAFCQTAGYALGVAGWATGLKLGSYSKGVVYSQHRSLGIAIFVFGTLQVFALLLRPKKEHKFRKYWNVYHHSLGYTVVVLSILNMFKGFDILRPDNKWKRAYIIVISTLGGIAVILEITSWIIYFRRRDSKGSRTSNSAASNGGRKRPGV